MLRIVLLAVYWVTMMPIRSSSDLTPILATYSCNQHISLVQPSQNIFLSGSDVYVKIATSHPNTVSFVDLYLNKEFIRRDQSYPFEWASPQNALDEELRNMPAGTYHLHAIVKDVCGKKKTISRKIMVTNATKIYRYNPIYELSWLKKINKRYHNAKISEYRKGPRTFFKVQPCLGKGQTNYWFDAQGRLVGKFSSQKLNQGKFSNARLIKCWADPCTTGRA